MENFRLFMGRLGNGITVCNAAVMEHGKILDAMPTQKMLENHADRRPLAEKLPDLRAWYYQNR